jgi:hypothetical protein
MLLKTFHEIISENSQSVNAYTNINSAKGIKKCSYIPEQA